MYSCNHSRATFTTKIQKAVSADIIIPKQVISEIHRSKISLHHAKSGYDYPTIRLPHTLSWLAGRATKIYRTVNEGAVAFLVVVSPRHEIPEMTAKPPYLHGEGPRFEFGRAHRSFTIRLRKEITGWAGTENRRFP